jgi:tRNA (guanine-N7-)-methyltransferase
MSYIKGYDYSLLGDVFFASETSSNCDWKRVFGNNNKLILEIGSGNGHFIVDKTLSDENSNFIGIEVKRDRVVRCREKQIKHKAVNLRFICGDAFFAVSKMFADCSINTIYMIFPDPWPKRKHHKNRLFKADFLDILHKKLENSGIFTFVTDYEEYYQKVYFLVKDDNRFFITMDSLNEDFSFTLFGQRWEKENKEFYGFAFKKI